MLMVRLMTADLEKSIATDSRLAGIVRAFARDRGGNIAILFTFMFGLLMMFAGGAVDYTRCIAVRSNIIDSMDAAGLAVARRLDQPNPPTVAEAKAYGEQFFYENFKYEHLFDEDYSDEGRNPNNGSIYNFNLQFDVDNVTVTPTVRGALRFYLLHVVDNITDITVDDCSLDVDTEITLQGSGRIELALVLDVTGSMKDPVSGSSKTRIESLRDSVDVLLDVMYGDEDESDNIRIGVVPFNAYVNVAGSGSAPVAGWETAWEDTAVDAVYHGARFLHVEGDGDVTGDGLPDIDDRSRITNWFANRGHGTNNGIAKVANINRKVSHYELFDSVVYGEGSSYDGWMGCVEARPYPLDELDIPAGTAATSADLTAAFPTLSSSDEPNSLVRNAFNNRPSFKLSNSELTRVANTRFVPYFQPDELDCVHTGHSSSAACRNNYGDADSSGIDRAEYTLNGVFRSLWHKQQMIDVPNGNRNQVIKPSANWVEDDDYVDPEEYSSSHVGRESFERYIEVVIGQRYAKEDSGAAQHDAYWIALKNYYENVMPWDSDHIGQEYTLRMAYPGWYDDALGIYRGKYDGTHPLAIDEHISATDDGMNGPNFDCAQPMLNFTTNKTTISDYVRGLWGNGNTNIALGAMWGWRLLSPEPPFTDGIAPSDPDFSKWQKAIVIMTDGDQNISNRQTFVESRLSAYGYPPEERMGQGVDTRNEMLTEMDRKLLRVCRRMKEEGYLIYTVMFDLNSSSTRNLFQACATEPNTPYFHDAGDDAALQEAFGDIAADLVQLHISR